MRFSDKEVKQDLKKYFYDCEIDDMIEISEIQGATLQRFIERTIISEVNKIKEGRHFVQQRLNEINENLVESYEMVYECEDELEDWHKESNLLILKNLKNKRDVFKNILDKLDGDTNE